MAILVEDENKVFSRIAEGLRAGVRAKTRDIRLKPSGEVALNALREFQPDAVVAVGDTAAAWANDFVSDLPLIICGVVQQSQNKDFVGRAGTSLDFSAAAYLTLAREAFTDLERAGVLYNPALNGRFAEDLRKAAQAQKVLVNTQVVQKEKSIGEAMQRLKNWGAQVLLLTYDPLIMNPETWKYLVGFSVTNRMAILVPSRSLLKTRGVLSLEADYEDLGKQTAEMVNAVLEGRAAREPGLQYPRRSEVGFNRKMADVVGVGLREGFGDKVNIRYE